MMNEHERDTGGRSDRLRAQGEDVLREGRDLASQAGDRANAALEDQKSSFASQIADISKAAKTAANDLRERDQGFVADWVERTADGIHHASESLRDKDLKSIYGEVESYARRQPAVFIAGTALVGFAISRFAKLAAERRDTPDAGSAPVSGTPEAMSEATTGPAASQPASPYPGGRTND